ncbi:PP2C family protein-serine/threonine phosphatase [candidate division KSB1 bacterium]|nr:PP2C family protein-serine/threonine phosphatase [candidate division KSB1 bacterium]
MTQEPDREIAKLKIAVEELSILNDLAITASTTLDVERMLDIIVRKSIKALKAEQGAIQLITEQNDVPLKTLIRQMDSENRLLNYKVGINITGWVLKYQKPLVIENLSKDERFQTTEQERKDIRSVLCVPIQFRAQLLGVLMVVNRKGGDIFSEEDQRLLCIIASQSGQLIHNMQMQQSELQKKKLEHELEMAGRIQWSLLPKEHPACQSFEISMCYEPAEIVAGDYYDYFILPDGKIGIVIADVSGHGTSAAMVMTLVKGVLCSVTTKYHSPSQVLTDVNHILSPIVPPHIFITMLFMELDEKQYRLRFSSAGHNPLVHYDFTRKTSTMIECKGLALGVREQVGYDSKELELHPGDFVLAYTDGITEVIDRHYEMFGEERLLQAVARGIQEKAEDVIGYIQKQTRLFIGFNTYQDDVAMIGIRVKE